LAAAEERSDKQTKRLSDKLREISDRAGLTRKEFVELTRKYKGNYIALAMAIKHGKEGVELQEAMTEKGKENVEAWTKVEEAEKKAAENRFTRLIPSIEGVTEKTKTWIDFVQNIGIKTTQDKAERTAFLTKTIDELNKAYGRGDMALWDYQNALAAAKKEIQDLATVQMSTALPAARSMVGVLDQAAAGYDKAKERSFVFRTATITDAQTLAENWRTQYEESIMPTFEMWGELLGEHWGYISQFTSDVNGAFNDMTEGMLQAFTEWGEGTTGILEGLAGVVTDFVDFNIAAAAAGVAAVYALFSKIKSFAEGGIVEEPTLAMIGEKGPEAVVPLERGRGTAEKLGAFGGGEIIIKPAPINLIVDGRVLATAIAKFTPELTKDGRMKIDTRGLIRG